ncbi:hypothetical protein CY0110_13446 [Crocosphaera chwakensis CCY0110]|uniref:Uncharacterized protein n=1 Tax=Crocosphaera chwakensis CCY0110 TaxID=391612 RepID=A3IPN8_9CHRO|nr:hypothetical protein CY0110_13446 [Crocosphaera chwakensis CCY0110]
MTVGLIRLDLTVLLVQFDSYRYFSAVSLFVNICHLNPYIERVPQEQLIYNELKISSHFLSLQDQLKFLINSDLRQQYESNIIQMASNTKYAGLVPKNWQNVPDQTVTNIYWFLKQTINS